MPHRLMKSLAFVSLLAVSLAGCAEDSRFAFEPKPEPEPPFLGPANLACGTWMPQQPDLETATFDLAFSGPNEVTPDQIAAVHDAGGVIHHTYRYAVVRATLPVTAVPTLVGNATWIEIDDPLRLPVFAQLDAAPTDDDRAFFASIGATDVTEHNFTSGHYVLAVVDDAVVAEIEARPNVIRSGYAGQVACIGVD